MEDNQTPQSADSPFRALRHVNFRLFWCGQLISLIGSWMQGLAQGWLILVLADPSTRAAVFSHGGDAAAAVQTHASAVAEHVANFYSGLINFANGAPILFLTLFAGVLADRFNKRSILLGTQSISLVIAFVTGLLIRERLITIDMLLGLSLALGITMSLDMPTRQSFVPELVPRRDLPSAVALNSSMFNAARALGPALSGYLLVRHVSLANCFFLNAVSYIAVLIGIFMMREPGLGEPAKREGPRENILANLKAGFVYVKNDHTASNLILLVGGFGMFAFSFNVLIPTFVKYTLLAGATEAAQIHAFGFLETIRGLGALVGAISVAVFATAGKQNIQLIVGSLLATLVLVVFAFARDMTVAYVTMAIVSFGFVLCFATCNTLMQMTVPDSLRGRVMAIYMLMFIGTGPVGSLLAGGMAARVGAPHTILFFALVSLAIAVYACFRSGGIRDLKAHYKPAPPRNASAVPVTEPGPEQHLVGGG